MDSSVAQRGVGSPWEKSAANIRWLAGLLEGEGTFRCQKHSPNIKLKMTDLDVVERAKLIMDGNPITSRQPPQAHYKTQFYFGVNGRAAAEWMMTLYSLMGVRRRARIRSSLELWRAGSVNTKLRIACPQGHPYSATGKKQYRDCPTCASEWQRRHRGRFGRISDGTTGRLF